MIIPAMQQSFFSVWAPRLSSLGVFAVLGATLVFWSLRWPAPHGQATAPEAQINASSPLDATALARALGARSSAPNTPTAEAPARYQLIGVVTNSGGAGAALIAVNGQPPKSFRVGTLVDGGLVLQSVAPRHAVLAPTDTRAGAAVLTLDMPETTKSTAP